MAGWDLKDGDEVATPSICSFHEGGWFEVEEFYSCGSGKKYADARLTKYYDIDMSERNGIKLALECLVDGATYDIPQSGGYTNSKYSNVVQFKYFKFIPSMLSNLLKAAFYFFYFLIEKAAY